VPSPLKKKVLARVPLAGGALTARILDR